jgi:hypothetical protein
MFTMALGRRGPAKRKVPGKGLRIAAALGTLILISVAVNASIIFADARLRQGSAVTTECSIITGQAGGSACRI